MESNLEQLKAWFSRQATSNKACWILYRLDGMGDTKRKIDSNFSITDPGESWQLLENNLIAQARNGVRKFEIVFKRDSKDSRDNPSYRFEVPFAYAMNPQQGQSIAGMPTGSNIGSLLEMKEKEAAQRIENIRLEQERRFEEFRRSIEHEKEMDELRAEIWELKEGKKDGVERTIESIERIGGMMENENVANGIVKILNLCGNLISGIMQPKTVQTPAISGGTVVREMPSKTAPPVEESEESNLDFNPVILAEIKRVVPEFQTHTDVNFNPAITAYLNMYQNGIKDGGEVMSELSDWIVGQDNPRQIIEMLQKLMNGTLTFTDVMPLFNQKQNSNAKGGDSI